MESASARLSVFLMVLICLLAEKATNCDKSDYVDGDLLVFTVASHPNDGYRRFMKSAEKYGYKVQVLGMGEPWKGGNMESYGGGYKVNLLKAGLEAVKNNPKQLVMFVDSYDVVFTKSPKEVLRVFRKSGAHALFSAEGFCWPDATVADRYPEVPVPEKRFLNSGGFIGYAPDIYGIVSHKEIHNTYDDQWYYTEIFLDQNLRDRFKMKLDTKAELFMNLHGALDEVTVTYRDNHSLLSNLRTGTEPMVVHGNGPIKAEFNTLANYLVDRWTPTQGCQSCNQDTNSLAGVPEDDYPEVMMAIFLEHPIPFVEEFFVNIANIQYPKHKITLFIHYAVEFHAKDVQAFMDAHGTEYSHTILLGPSQNLNQWEARNRGLGECHKVNCPYYLSLDGEAHIDAPETLIKLIESNRSVVAPVLVRPGKLWSNFWGALGRDGFYKRSSDYLDILHKKQTGEWNVPYMTMVYLIQGYLIPELIGGYVTGDLDADMAICKRIREVGAFMFANNMQEYGHLIHSDNHETEHLHNDLYSIFDNPADWEKKYIHPDYKKALSTDWEDLQPCPDVYWYPLVTDKFCQDYIEEMENFGQWSGGKNVDPRIAGGYENVPTVDIHTNQIGWERHWLHILATYITPLNQKVFLGYYSEAKATMNFVVRYKPGEQDRLRPHHDASTFSVNLALNQKSVDYEGGGTSFLRYNCSVEAPRKGWFLMHPGRLTHLHEGLPTTKGTRYIMVSFVDP